MHPLQRLGARVVKGCGKTREGEFIVTGFNSQPSYSIRGKYWFSIASCDPAVLYTLRVRFCLNADEVFLYFE